MRYRGVNRSLEEPCIIISLSELAECFAAWLAKFRKQPKGEKPDVPIEK